jgi:hypothetical protein
VKRKPLPQQQQQQQCVGRIENRINENARLVERTKLPRCFSRCEMGREIHNGCNGIFLKKLGTIFN